MTDFFNESMVLPRVKALNAGTALQRPVLLAQPYNEDDAIRGREQASY